MFSLKPPRPTFRSYLLPPPQAEDKFDSEPKIKKLEPVLLPGEIVVNEVSFVRKCIATDTSQYDLWGKLICSNFKISFVTDDPMPLQKFHYRNLLLGEHDVPLTCIEQIVAVNDHKRKQKVLGPNQKLKFNPTELIIYCKDFRIVRFRFDESGPESAKKVCLAIAHYSQPTDLQLLFAFEYVGKKYHSSASTPNGLPAGGGPGGAQKTPLFEAYSDWDREVKRTGASGWRVSSVNEGYMISTCLPEYFVVPSSLADQDLKTFSHSFVGRRMPLWSWSHPNGSALVRTALVKDLQQRKIDQRICNAITKSHPQRSDVHKSDLDKTLPNIQEIQAAFVKLKHLCVNEPFEETEERWLSSLESTRWLEYVRGGGQRPELRGCISRASDAGSLLQDHPRVPEPGSEGVGDGGAPVPGPVQPPQEVGEGVAAVPAVPGRHVAAAGPVPGRLRVLRDLPGRAGRQHPHLPVRHLPVQLAAPAGEAEHGVCHQQEHPARRREGLEVPLGVGLVPAVHRQGPHALPQPPVRRQERALRAQQLREGLQADQEKLQLHAAGHARLPPERTPRRPGLPPAQELPDPAGEAGAASARRGPGRRPGAVLRGVALQAGRPARPAAAPPVGRAHKALETVLLPLGPRGPDRPRGLHHRLPPALAAGRRGGRAEQDAAAAPGRPAGGRLRRARPEPHVLPGPRPPGRLGHAGLPLLLLPLLPRRQPLPAQHLGHAAERVPERRQDLAVHGDAGPRGLSGRVPGVLPRLALPAWALGALLLPYVRVTAEICTNVGNMLNRACFPRRR
ncbi:myotubularin-related protein 10 isoform X2 [Pipistrellus kuhlii]|uniref:myotubularin-related protein 10 isoform X2 n=1 Tax=Pipistrellus kuhlii TaxID=59472 RepID=UPI001E26FF4B|nr:myotubularin-related protein 10 isoform X2 [Pipistrellus kuhlii]